MVAVLEPGSKDTGPVLRSTAAGQACVLVSLDPGATGSGLFWCWRGPQGCRVSCVGEALEPWPWELVWRLVPWGLAWCYSRPGAWVCVCWLRGWIHGEAGTWLGTGLGLEFRSVGVSLAQTGAGSLAAWGRPRGQVDRGWCGTGWELGLWSVVAHLEAGSMEASLAFGPWELAWHYSEPVAGDGAGQHLVP